MRNKALRIALWGSIGIIVIIQAFQIDHSNPPSDPALDFLKEDTNPAEVGSILKRACFDCHSNYTRYPWYSYFNPVGWKIGEHIDEGREEMNFSVWETYSKKRKDHKLEECIEEMEEGHMPLPDYLRFHPEAELSKEESKMLMSYFHQRREAL